MSLEVTNPDHVPALRVGPGCVRRDLPAGPGVRVWIVDMEPNTEWPYVDEHDELGEAVFVVSGELIEGHRRITAGNYVSYGPGSSHRPRTETGVRLFGVNAHPARASEARS